MAKDDSPNISKLKGFMRRYNMPAGRGAPRIVTADDWQVFGSEVVKAAYEQYFDNNNCYRGMRPSNAYKPAIVHMLNKFGYGLEPEVIKWNRAYAPMIGHVTEALAYVLLREAGVEFTRGKSLSVLNGAMHGTPDFMCDDAVVDVKSMNGYYFKKFSEQPDDDRGYVTQLHLYADALGVRNMYVLAFCKDYASAKLINVSYDAECLESVVRRVDVVNAATSVDAIRNCPIPPLVKARNGLTVLPQLSYDACKHLLYVMEDEDAEFCKTAIRARSHDEVLDLLLTPQDPHMPPDDVYGDDALPY